MNKEFPVGKAQQMVLDAIGMTAENAREAEKIFEDLNIVVLPVRQGKTSVPHVGLTTRNMTGDDSYSRKIDALKQWM